MNDRSLQADMSNAMEWVSGRITLDGGVDFEIFVSRCGIPGGTELPLPHSLYCIRFERVASLARVSMVWMLQYYTGDKTDPPVLEELAYDGDQTFMDDFTVNTEAHGKSWKRFRITTQDDVIDIISDSPPTVIGCHVWENRKPAPG